MLVRVIVFPCANGIGILWEKQKKTSEMLSEFGCIVIVFKIYKMSQENYHFLSKKNLLHEISFISYDTLKLFIEFTFSNKHHLIIIFSDSSVNE